MIKSALRELSECISANRQALDNAISEIEYLEKQNLHLQQQILQAYQLSDGQWLSLEELCDAYNLSLSKLSKIASIDVSPK